MSVRARPDDNALPSRLAVMAAVPALPPGAALWCPHVAAGMLPGFQKAWTSGLSTFVLTLRGPQC